MKIVHCSICVLLALTFFCTSALAYPPTPEDPWGGLLETDEFVSYTEEDAQRYLEYYRKADVSIRGSVYMSLEERHESYLNDPDIRRLSQYDYPSLPVTGDFTKEEAACIAYAWLEQQKLIAEDAFVNYYTVTHFQANNFDSLRLWSFEFRPIDHEAMPRLDTFFVYIDSQTGHIVYTAGSSRALG